MKAEPTVAKLLLSHKRLLAEGSKTNASNTNTRRPTHEGRARHDSYEGEGATHANAVHNITQIADGGVNGNTFHTICRTNTRRNAKNKVRSRTQTSAKLMHRVVKIPCHAY